MARDEQADTVSASGDVMIVQAGRILRADEVLYDVGADRVQADGNVVLNEESGDIHLVDHAAYSNSLQDGEVENLRTVLNDGSRFTAARGALEGGTKTTMEDASYTPCELCKDHPDKPPLWGIVASEVRHDQKQHMVSYRHARFEVKGVPVAYTPYFSHPDGTIKQKSGFLAPSLGYKSDLGAFAETSYYWAIAPDQDATFGVMAMTQQAPLGLAEYRKRWSDASLKMSGGVTYSDRTDRTAGQDVAENDEVRGHIFAQGRWDMDEKWRSGLNVQWTSDDQYMRQYDFTNEDVLENELYAERFSGRNYAAGRLLSFQDIRIRETPLDQPDILPEIVASFKGEPGAVPLVKGQWRADASALGLRRDNGEQDVQRLSLDTGWRRRLVSDYGLLTRVDASVRGDVYYSTDRQVATAGSGRSKSSTNTRVFPQLHVQSSYPMARPFEAFQARVEPVAALTLAPNVTGDDSIPNEDSNDVQIDASNIFEPNRFPGLDRVEDRSHVTYGMRSGLFGYDGNYGDIFLGQSYQLKEGDNPFPYGSGLERRESDYVGQISGSYKNIYDLDYRFQMASDDLSSQRHEVDASADWNRFRLNARYLYAGLLGGTDIEESREQADASAQFYFNKEWRTRFGATQDLGENPGLRKAFAGLDYLGQCLFWSLTGERNLTRDASGESSTEVLFRIGLKNIGEFEESSLRPARKSGG
ncbi:MAG: LPS-assembly protein LptD [Rhodospirillales bacterium]|nr:LPS-assembly protein LptD [Rhodospirillales bacterium]